MKLVMDLPLWEPFDDQVDRNCHVVASWQFDHRSSYGGVDNQSSYCIGDHWFSGPYLWRDVIEEDALNEKYCVEVLRMLMDKADEEILGLEEDIVMLQCQLAWDDDDWSKPCSAAITEKIRHLDNLIQSLKMDNTEYAHCFDSEFEQLEKPPQRIHDLVKPLLEHYFSAKIMQRKGSVTRMSVLCTAELSKKNLGASSSKHDEKLYGKECINLQKESESKSLAVEPEDKNINNPQQVTSDQKKDACTRKCISDANKCAYYKLSEKDMKKLNRLQGKRVPNLAPVKSGWRSFKKSELFNPMTKISSTNTSINEGSLRERSKNKKNEKEVDPMVKSSQHRSKVTSSHLESEETGKRIAETIKSADVILDPQLRCVNQNVGASSKTQKARMNRHMMNRNALIAKLMVTVKRKRTKSPEKMEALEAQWAEGKDANSDSLVELLNYRTKHTGKLKMKVEPKFELQQIPEIENLVQAKSICSLKPKDQGPEKNCWAAPEIVEQLSLAKEVDMGSSSTETLKRQRNLGVQNKFRKSCNIEIEQELHGAEMNGSSKDTISSISSSQKKRKSTPNSQNIRGRKGIRNFLMKLEKPDDDDIRNSLANEAIETSPLFIKDRDGLSLNDLKTIARNQKLPGYYRLRKAELQKRLGLQPQEAREKKGQDTSLQT